ncbi:ADP-ribosyltransferase [Mycolicibacterium conceptionense]|uniref:ADP-ribosyltransferase n=1 Tax=Mycolicibacterium conceptionense TaxID=451644 RepID=UPI0013FE2CAB|nr:ADP-ribosyltransferase [Mycolicibacterium conceptionense]
MTDFLDPFDGLGYSYLTHPIGQLTEEERTQIEWYALGGFDLINRALRGLTLMTSDLEERVSLIRSALHRFPLEFDTRVTREIGAADIGLSASDEAPQLVGRPLRDAAFLSTSMKPDPPRSPTHRDPIELDLRVPAGTPALAVGSLSDYPLERELLVIDARQIFIVESQKRDTKRWRLYGVVLPEGGVL